MKKEKRRKRHCGECKACCIVYPITVPEIAKDAMVPCKHLNDKGCGIYSTRPTLCQEFECIWLQGLLPGSDRPDRLGVVFQSCNATGFEQGGVISASELFEGAFEKPRAKALIDAMLEGGIPIYKVKFDQTKIACGRLAEKFIEITRNKGGHHA